MAVGSPNEPSEQDLLRAMLALQIADREEVGGGPHRRTEVVLDNVGFNYAEIAALTGHEREAVRSTVRRETGAAAKAKSKPKAGANGSSKRKGASKNG